MWYCLFENKQFGPYTTQEAVTFVGQHENVLVWREGMADWLPAERISALSVQEVQLPSPARTSRSDLSFQIHGDDLQYVEIELPSASSIIAEPGSMIFKDSSITLEASLSGKKSQSAMGSVMKRLFSGESAFLSVFTNTSVKPAKISFSAPYPGKIIPVSPADCGGELICQKDSFLCAQDSVDIDVFFQRNIMTGYFGGGGFIMQRLVGDGVAFINAGGTIAERELEAGETIHTNVGALVAFTPSVRFDIEAVGNFKSMLFGGSGVFFASLTGPGKVWIQSLPFSRLVHKIASQAYKNRK